MKLIGITPDLEPVEDEIRYGLRTRYSHAISSRGAMPVIIPAHVEFIDKYLDMIDGLVLSGGPIIPSDCIKNIEEYKDAQDFAGKRIYFEYQLLQKALERDMPVLGICFGEQLINLVYGGSIKSNIPNHIHNVFEYTHKVDIKEDSKLYDIVGEKTININTLHSQAVDEIGGGLEISAISEDGIVEAIEDKSKTFCVGVQWHPEAEKGKAEKSDEIFDCFLKAVEAKKNIKN